MGMYRYTADVYMVGGEMRSCEWVGNDECSAFDEIAAAYVRSGLDVSAVVIRETHPNMEN